MPLLSCAAHRFRSARFAARLSRRWACAAALRPSESPGPERFFSSQTLLLFCFFCFSFLSFSRPRTGVFLCHARGRGFLPVRGRSMRFMCAELPAPASVRRLSALFRAVASALASALASHACFALLLLRGSFARLLASHACFVAAAFRACFSRRVLPQFQEIVILRSFIAQSVR